MKEPVVQTLVRQKDPVYTASGRLSHAVRVGADADVILALQQELVVAQVGKYLMQRFGEVKPTRAQAKELCKLITEAAAAA